MNCLFCKIINNEIPSYTVYEDEIVKAFLDINPDSNGHLLIIPKEHTLDLESIDMETLNHILIVAKKLKKILEDKLLAVIPCASFGAPEYIRLSYACSEENIYQAIKRLKEFC